MQDKLNSSPCTNCSVIAICTLVHYKQLTVVNVDTMQAKNVCHDNFMFQNDDTSSIENNSPPTGAPKAEATPAAAPAEMKLRLFDI